MTAIAGWLHGSFASEVEINELKINIVVPVCRYFPVNIIQKKNNFKAEFSTFSENTYLQFKTIF